MGISLYAEAMDLPLFRREITGTPVSHASIEYSVTEGDEVEDLYQLLKQVKVPKFLYCISIMQILIAFIWL